MPNHPNRGRSDMTAEQFKAARLALGLTQEEMAAALGLAHYQSVLRFENGKRVVSKAKAKLVEAMLKAHQET